METTIARLQSIIEQAPAQLSRLSEAESGKKISAARWSAKEILGHLVDSAANNHQRFVRAQMSEALTFPAYEQERWVNCQGYHNEPWADLVALWTGYNKHLLHIIKRVPAEKLQTPCVIGDGGPKPLSFLIDDYVRHLEHHLTQIAGIQSKE